MTILILFQLIIFYISKLTINVISTYNPNIHPSVWKSKNILIDTTKFYSILRPFVKKIPLTNILNLFFSILTIFFKLIFKNGRKAGIRLIRVGIQTGVETKTEGLQLSSNTPIVFSQNWMNKKKPWLKRKSFYNCVKKLSLTYKFYIMYFF